MSKELFGSTDADKKGSFGQPSDTSAQNTAGKLFGDTSSMFGGGMSGAKDSGNTAGSSLFGGLKSDNTTGSSGGLFGASKPGTTSTLSDTTFGQPKTALFGEAQKTNNTTNSTSGLFANKTDSAQNSLFGNKTDGAQSGLFGNKTDGAQSGLFGNKTDSAQSGLFGNKPDSNKTDGAQSSLFGNKTDSAQSGLFGNTADSSKTGNAQSSLFGSANNATKHDAPTDTSGSSKPSILTGVAAATNSSQPPATKTGASSVLNQSASTDTKPKPNLFGSTDTTAKDNKVQTNAEKVGTAIESPKKDETTKGLFNTTSTPADKNSSLLGGSKGNVTQTKSGGTPEEQLKRLYLDKLTDTLNVWEKRRTQQTTTFQCHGQCVIHMDAEIYHHIVALKQLSDQQNQLERDQDVLDAEMLSLEAQQKELGNQLKSMETTLINYIDSKIARDPLMSRALLVVEHSSANIQEYFQRIIKEVERTEVDTNNLNQQIINKIQDSYGGENNILSVIVNILNSHQMGLDAIQRSLDLLNVKLDDLREKA